MSRIASLVVLVVILLLIAVAFFWVMSRFVLPLFLAAVLVVIFQPVHHWLVGRCHGRDRLAAGLTTATIMLAVLLPMLAIIIPATFEGVAIYHELRERYRSLQEEEAKESHEELREAVGRGAAGYESRPEAEVASGETPPGVLPPGIVPEALREEAEEANPSSAIRLLAKKASQFSQTRLGLALDPVEIERTVTRWVNQVLTPLAVGTTQFLADLIFGTLVLVVALYFFLADGPVMIRQIMRLSPLDDRYEQQLVDEFGNICRAVVMATLVSAFIQGLLMGAALYVAGFESVFLLTVLTMLVAMIPFVGTPAVSLPACLWLFFHDGRPVAAILLAIFAFGVVSTVDNFIKPWILHGRSNLHPLLALLSVLGGVQVLGPIGIFVGPMVVAFFHALLKMLQTALREIGQTRPQPPPVAA